MSETTIFKLKQHVTEDNLVSVGFVIHDQPVTLWRVALREIVGMAIKILIPLEPCEDGERVIQYNLVGTDPEDMNPEDIEDLVAQGWVEEIEI